MRTDRTEQHTWTAKTALQGLSALAAFAFLSACENPLMHKNEVDVGFHPGIEWDLSKVKVEAGATVIKAGTKMKVTVWVYDKNGAPFASKGAKILGNLINGTSAGTFSNFTNVGDGSYTADFTGTVAGSPGTISPTMNGASVVTTLPQVQVIPGDISLENSQLSVSADTVTAGSDVVVRLAITDAQGNRIPETGLASFLSFDILNLVGSGSSTGTFISPIVDHNDGSYTLNFRGLTAGAPIQIRATINGNGGPISPRSKPTVRCVAGNASAANSILTVSAPTVVSGSNIQIKLVTRDGLGNLITTGNNSVQFSYQGGSSTGAIGTVVDQMNGTYVANFTGIVAGTPTTIHALLNGQEVTTTLPLVEVLTGPLSLAASSITVSSPVIAAGNVSTLTLTPRDANGNSIVNTGFNVTFSATGGTSTGTISPSPATALVTGQYTAGFTGLGAGSAKTIGATILGYGSISGNLPTITVQSGSLSLANSLISVSSPSLYVGQNIQLILTAKDTGGNQMTTGGLSVAFAISTGAGLGTGTIGAVTDQGNGTYTAPLTGVSAGNAVAVTATIGGQPVTSSSPLVSIQTPPLSLSLSSITVSSPTVASGSQVTITLTARDINNAVMTSLTGVNVQFNLTMGTSTGSLGAVVDNHNGTYSAPFTGILAGTPLTIGAVIAGNPVTAAPPQITVVAGPFSLANSTLGVSAPTVASGSSVIATLTARDAQGNLNPVGITSVSFGMGSGSAGTGSFSPTTGTYQSNFTGALAGLVYVSASINGQAITSTLPTVTVQSGSATNLVLSGTPSPVVAGNTYTLTVTAKDAGGNTVTNYGGVVSFNSSDGQAVLPGSYSFQPSDHGVKAFSIILKTAGGQTVSVSDPLLSPTTATASVTVNPGPYSLPNSTLSYSGSNPIAAGGNITVVLTPRDAYGNLYPTGIPAIVFSSSGLGSGSFGATSGPTSPNGTYAAVFTAGGTGTVTISVTTGGQPVPNSLPTFTILPGGATQLALSGSPSSVVAGTNFNLTVTAKDSGGNTATGFLGTVNFSSSDVQGVMPASYTFVAGDQGVKVFAFTLKTAGAQTISAASSGLSTAVSPSITVTAGAAASLALNGASSTSSGANYSLTITAKDAYGNTATGYLGTVSFSSNDTAATLPANYTFLAADNGSKAFNSLVLRTAGSKNVSVSDGTRNASISVTVNAGAASSLALSDYNSTTTAGANYSITVTAKDANGNIVSGFTGTVSFSSTDSAAVLPANYTFVAGDNGSKVFSSLILKTAGARTISVVSGSLNATSSTITVNAGSALVFALSGASSTVAGAAYSLTVTAKDAYNNTAVGYVGTASFSSTDSAATLPANYTFLAGDQGVKIFSVVLRTVGSRTITASDGFVGGTSSAIAVNSASAGSFYLSGLSSTTAGANYSLTITAKDAYGNTATGYLGTASFSSTDSAATLPSATAFLAGDNGIKVVTVILKTAGSKTISASDGSLNGTSPAITVNAGSATTLAVSGGSSATVGVAYSLTVTAKDAYGNTVTGFTGTVSFSSSDTAATLPSNYTFVAGDNGSKVFSVILNTVGSKTISVASGSMNATTPTITVSSGTATTLALSGASSTVAGANYSLTVTAKDSAGNTVTNYTGTVSFSSTDSAATLPANYTFVAGDNGSKVFTVVLKTVGSKTISANGGSISGTSSSITVTAGAASSLALSGYNSTTTAGANYSITITAKDAYGNTATGYTGTVTYSSTDSAATLPSSTIFSAGDNGVKTVSTLILKTAGSRTISITDGTRNATTSGITVNAGAATVFALTGAGTATAGGSYSLTVTAKDAYGNTVTNYVGTVSFTSNDPSAVLPSSYTFVAGDAGVKTFSVIFVTAGSRTVTASDGTRSGTCPAVTVGAGAPSLSLSVVTASSSSVASGASITLTLTVKDSNGNMTSGGLTNIAFTQSGSGTGTMGGSITDNNNGTYTTSFTGVLAGSVSLSATIGGSPLTSVPASVVVGAGALNIANSTLATSTSSISVGGVATLTVTAKDSAGNLLTAGGLSVAISKISGTSTGTIGSITDNTNGTYTASFTGTGAGTAAVLRATISGNTVPNDVSVTVNVAGISLEVPIEMIDGALASQSSVTIFDMSQTRLDTNDYDGSPVYSFEIVAKNASSSSKAIDLVDASGSVKATINVNGSSSDTRYRTTFTPNEGSNLYRVRIAALSGSSNVVLSTARIIVKQTTATKTRLYFPMMGENFSLYEDRKIYGVDETTSTSYTQGSDMDYTLWKKDTSNFATIASGDAWTFDAVIFSTKQNDDGDFSSNDVGGTCYVALHNVGTGSRVTSSELSTTSVTPAFNSASFSDSATNFTNLSTFEARIKATSGARCYIAKAGLWVKLSTISKGEVYYRVERGLTEPSSDIIVGASRLLLDLSLFSSSTKTVYLEATGKAMSSAATFVLQVLNAGTNDSGTSYSSVLSGCSINAANLTTTRSRYRSSACGSITNGNRYISQFLEDCDTVYKTSSFMVVRFQ